MRNSAAKRSCALAGWGKSRRVRMRVRRVTRVRDMYQDLDDEIEVIALFERRQVRPCRFRWRGKIYKVDRITGDWTSDVGQAKLRFFAVVDSMANFFQLCYDERSTSWKIAKVWVE